MRLSKRRTICLSVVFIAAFFLIMYFANRLLCLKTMHGSSQCLGMYAQPRDTVDVVMLGSSHMHCDVDPSVLWEEQGIASYVFSAAEQPMWLTYYYLLEICKYQTPKLVVVDVYSPARYGDDFNMQWIGENLYNIRFSLNKIMMLLTTCSMEEIKNYFPSLFGYHSRYEDIGRADLERLFSSKNDVNFKGFVPFFDTLEGYRPTLDVEEKGNIEPKSELYLKKIMDYTKEHGIELFLVVNPYPTTAEDELIYNRIHELADAEGVLFRSTNYDGDEIGLDHDKDYSDESHLNYSGSRKYSSFLGKTLKENFDLPDRRGTKGYESWDRNAEIIKEMYGQ